MSTYIHASEVLCGLGSSTRECLRGYLNYTTQAQQSSVSRLNMPVSFPYFALKKDEPELPHENMFAILKSQVESLLAQTGISTGERERTGLFVGSSSFSANASEHKYLSQYESESDDALVLPNVGYGKITKDLRVELGLSPHSYTYATACTSSANAALYAKFFINAGLIDHAVVLGYEFFNLTTVLGFHGLDLVSSQKALRPFDSRRDGLILGEGSGCLFLSKEKKSSSVQLAGGAIQTDSHSLTAANPDGSSIELALSNAMQSAGVRNDDVVAIKTHGTASILNDEAEAAGILRQFGEKCPPLIAMKPYLGHTLGACGAIEMALLVEAISNGIVPSNPGIACDDHYDKELKIGLSQSNLKASPGAYLCDFFAFGGNNAVIALTLD